MISVYGILLCISFNQPVFFTVLIPRHAFIAGSFLLIFGSLVIFFYTIQQNRVHQNVYGSYEHFKQGNYTAVIKDMQVLRSRIEGDEQALLMYGKSLAMNNRHLEAIGVYNLAESVSSNNFLYINKGESYQKIGEFAMAEKAYFHAWNIVPNRLYPQYKLAKLYVESNDTSKAKIWAERVVSHVDKVPSFSVNLMKKEMRMYLDSLNASKYVM
jgi:tetratricopeptide (TPR) repeat protein